MDRSSEPPAQQIDNQAKAAQELREILCKYRGSEEKSFLARCLLGCWRAC